jgi:hypothetical protein
MGAFHYVSILDLNDPYNTATINITLPKATLFFLTFNSDEDLTSYPIGLK